MASLNVLNVGAGDVALTFNHLDDDEAKKALRILTDMQERGYAIIVQTEDGQYARAKAIDRTRGRYIIQLPEGAPLPPGAEEIDMTGVAFDAEVAAAQPPAPGHETRGADLEPIAPKKRGRGRRVGVPIARASATGVARSAGG